MLGPERRVAVVSVPADMKTRQLPYISDLERLLPSSFDMVRP